MSPFWYIPMDTSKTINPPKAVGKGSYFCSWSLIPILGGLIYGLIYLSAAMVIGFLGPGQYTSSALDPKSAPFLLFISFMLGAILVGSFFSPSRISAWFEIDKDGLPIYGLETYLSSFGGSLFAGNFLSIVFLLLLNIVSIFSGTFSFAYLFGFALFWPTQFITGILFSLLIFGTFWTPKRANAFIHWKYKDFWKSRI